MSRVVLYHCDSIERIPLKLESIIDSLGRERITGLFRDKRVLLKPNVCIDFPPERGATTHPALLDAMIGAAKDLGASIVAGDGPIVGVKGKVFEKAGISEVCRKHDVEMINFNRVQGEKVRLEDALVLHEALIAKICFEVDTIVNLPVFKSNMLYWLSGALKNMKGFLVGTEKHKAHYLGVPQSVADLNRMVRQDLVIMDGFIGMMGDGPAMGRPADARLIMGGFDPVALDAAAAKLMGFNAGRIPMLKWAEQAGAGSTDYEIVGDPMDSFQMEFDPPQIAKIGKVGYWIDSLMAKIFPQLRKNSRIHIELDKCTYCARCEEMCPFNAIVLKKKSIEIDKDNCNLCLCCLEVCEKEAIKFKGLLAHTEIFFR